MKKIKLLIFIFIFLISACSTQTAAPTQQTAATKSAATKTPSSAAPTAESGTRLKVNEDALQGLQVTVWTPWYGIEASLFDTLAAEFNSTNEWGIQIASQHQVNYSNLYETVTAALPTADRPDLAIALPEHALDWNEDGFVTDLSAYTSDPKFGFQSQDFPSVFWDQDLAGDIRAGIPAQRTASVLLWNESWAGEIGFDSVPQTPEDFSKQACKAQMTLKLDASAENDFMGGWVVDTQPATAYAWMLAFGGSVLEGDSYRFLTPNNIDSFRFVRELSEAGCAWQTTTETDPIPAFVNREALFISVSLQDLPSVARAFAAANNNDVWKAIAYPGLEQDALFVYGSSYVILNSKAEEQLAAWLFVRWMLENEQDARWVETTHLFPLRTSTMNLLADYEKTHPQWKQAVDLLPQGTGQPQASSWRKVKTMLGDGFRHMYRVNTPSGQVAAILAQMQNTANDLSK